jgi:hypothetical protein
VLICAAFNSTTQCTSHSCASVPNRGKLRADFDVSRLLPTDQGRRSAARVHIVDVDGRLEPLLLKSGFSIEHGSSAVAGRISTFRGRLTPGLPALQQTENVSRTARESAAESARGVAVSVVGESLFLSCR